MGAKEPEIAQSVLRACELLKAFRYSGELLRLRDLVARTNLSKTTTFRLLSSLEAGGLIERVGREQYRALVGPVTTPQYRLGFAAPRLDSLYCNLVTESIRRAAIEAGLDLVVVNNRRSPAIALRNTNKLIAQAVDLVIEFQLHARVAASVAARFIEAGIPVIAIDVPHPGANYYGADNYRAGRLGGQGLADWARRHWNGQVEEVLLLEERHAGPLVRLRLTGMLGALRENLAGAESCIVTELDGRGMIGPAFETVRRHLRAVPPRRTLIGAGTDSMALGAIRAFDEVGRMEYCAAMGQNAEPEAREELRRPGTRLIGSVAYFPERYGPEVIKMAMETLSGKPHSPARYVKHELVTLENVNSIYPLDSEVPDWMEKELMPFTHADGSPGR